MLGGAAPVRPQCTGRATTKGCKTYVDFAALLDLIKRFNEVALSSLLFILFIYLRLK